LGQSHHLVVVLAIDQGLAEGSVAFAEGHKGVELTNFLQKALQISNGHGGRFRD
jgi:hypothetical protein